MLVMRSLVAASRPMAGGSTSITGVSRTFFGTLRLISARSGAFATPSPVTAQPFYNTAVVYSEEDWAKRQMRNWKVRAGGKGKRVHLEAVWARKFWALGDFRGGGAVGSGFVVRGCKGRGGVRSYERFCWGIGSSG